jgi:hypothetical protein
MSLKFRSQLQVDNLPDPMTSNRWEVIMPEMNIGYLLGGNVGWSWLDAQNGRYSPIVEEITFAPLGFKNSQDIRAITNYYNVPVDKQDAKEANITFYCDTNMKAQYYIKAWREMVFNEADEYYYLPYQYKRDILVYFYGLGSTTPVISYKLKGCYPLLQDDFSLKYSKQAERLRISQKFNVDRVIISGGYGSGISSVLGSVGNIANNLRNAVTHWDSSFLSAKKVTGVSSEEWD